MHPKHEDGHKAHRDPKALARTKPSPALFSRVNLYSSSLYHILSGCGAVVWILVSAGPLRSICRVDTYLPSMTTQLEKYLQLFHVSSGYGLFRRMTGVGAVQGEGVPHTGATYGGLPASIVARPEVVLEGLHKESSQWLEIPFRYKPTALDTAPVFVAPHQPRLDWQMWFAALASYNTNPWLLQLADKLLQDDSYDVIALLDKDNYPFKNSPPAAIRAILYDYDFTRLNTSWARRTPFTEIIEDDDSTNESERWWTRRNGREYFPALEANNPSLEQFLQAHGISKRPYLSEEEHIDKCLSLGTHSPDPLFMKDLRRAMCRSSIMFTYTPDFGQIFGFLLATCLFIYLCKHWHF